MRSIKWNVDRLFHLPYNDPDYDTLVIKRFFDKVLVPTDPNECWIWIGCINNKGYGQIRIRDEAILAHRWIYELFHGPIPEKLVLLHACDRPYCVNPVHLSAGTTSDNQQDSILKGRRPDLHGERVAHHKLTDEKVLEIRRLRSEGYTLHHLADLFQVTHQNIFSIVHGETWTHLL